MRKLSRILAVLLAAVMVLGAFVACKPANENKTTPEPKSTDAANNTPDPNVTPGSDETTAPETDKPADATPVPDIPLVVAYSPFSQKFSPFYADTAYDQDVASMVGLGLMTTDRMGGIIYNAIAGETVLYNGTDYLYTGPADLSVKYDKASDLTVYTAKIRDDLKFSDGTPITAKDILFTYYTYLDPSYVGSNSLSSYDIIGLQNYRTQTSDEVYDKYATIYNQMVLDGRGDGYVAREKTVVEAFETLDDPNASTAEKKAKLKQEQAIKILLPDATMINPEAKVGDVMICYDEALYNDLWNRVDTEYPKEAWMGTCQAIVNYCMSNYVDSYAEDMLGKTPEEVKGNEGLQVAFGMAAWGFGELGEDGLFTDGENTWDLETEFPTIEDYYNATFAAYDGDALNFFITEKPSNEANLIEPIRLAFIRFNGSEDPAMGDAKFNSIEGIKMVDDYTVEVTLQGYSAPAVYSVLGITVTPLHYYGDTAKWDPDNGKYGFDLGDLSTQKAKTEVPLGAGPYIFESYKDKVVTFKANENYYKGKPIIETIKFKETASAEVATALSTGDADCGEMTGSRTRFEEVTRLNGNGDIVGPVITTIKVDNLGYGYIGLNADTINVGGNPSSAESKALRKAIATVLAVYRDVSFESYYGEAASVIQYPISNTSWAAPQASDPDYKIAFSEDPQGNPIYTASMSADDKYAAALEASLAWFEAAGYTVADGKLTAAPEGAKLDYEVIIPGDGQQDHPSYNVLSMAREAFETIGFTLIINDPADSNVLWNALDSGEQEMWCAAWGSTIDPDMYQVYHSNNIVGKGGTDSNHYHIADAQLDQLIMDARTSDDQSFRKTVYKQCLDIIVDWAVEIPAYQRQNCTVFSTERINLDTLTPDITTFWGWMNDIEKLEMKYN